MTKQELSERLKKYRADNNLTQYDMAKLIGCNIGTYRFWEMGIGLASPKYSGILQEILGK